MDSTSPRLAVVSFSDLSRDARVIRHIAALSRYFEVHALGYGRPALPPGIAVKSVEIPLPRLPAARHAQTLALLSAGRIYKRAYETWYWSRPDNRAALRALLDSQPAVIVANDWTSLPVAAEAARHAGARVMLDLHEYAPLEWENRLYWRWLFKPAIEYFLGAYLPSVAAATTVAESIADRYAAVYGIRPTVVMNLPPRSSTVCFRATDPARIELVHHGGAIRDRRLELMIEAMARADERFSLHFMLIEASRGYIGWLRSYARRAAPGRVLFHEPVPPHQVIDALTRFDVGVFLLPFTNYNYRQALPNKFFDFVAAGLAVCIGPSPEMARLVERFHFGATAPSFEPADLARTLNNLSASEIDEMKHRALETRVTLNAETEEEKLVSACLALVQAA